MWAFSSDGKARLAVKRRRDGVDDRSDADRLLDRLARDTRLAQRPIMGIDTFAAAIDRRHRHRPELGIRLFLEACRLSGPSRNEVFQAASLRTVIQMVAGGLGVTLVPQLALASELATDGPLIARPRGPDAPTRRIALAWRRSAVRKPEFRRLGTYIY